MKPIASLPGILLSACTVVGVRPDSVDLRWRVRPGDVYEVRVFVSHEGTDLDQQVRADLLLMIESVRADGCAIGAMHLRHFSFRAAGPPEARLVFADGRIEEATGCDDLEARFETQARLLPIELLPTGRIGARPGAVVGLPFLLAIPSLPGIGLLLPGREVGSRESWTGTVQAARCDPVETSFAVASTAGTAGIARIRGRSTPEAEAVHGIRVSAEASYDSREGYVKDAKIDLDFAALGLDDRITIVHEIRRRHRPAAAACR